MKNIFLVVVLAIASIISAAQSKQTVKKTGTRFTFPIFQKWISEYNNIHPPIELTIASGIPAGSADIIIAYHLLRQGDIKKARPVLQLPGMYNCP